MSHISNAFLSDNASLFRRGDSSDSKKVAAFIFDMDGLLLDTERLCKICWNRIGKKYAISDSAIEKAYRLCVGRSNEDTLEILRSFFKTSKPDFNVSAFYKEACDCFFSVEKEIGLPKMQGTDECLSYLSKKGFTLALASSTSEVNVRRQLKNAGIIGYFKTITCGDCVVRSKPDPEIYIKACASLNLPPSFCVALEDSPNGVRSATSAGMRCVMIPDQIQPDDEIKSLAWKIVPSLSDIISLFP